MASKQQQKVALLNFIKKKLKELQKIEAQMYQLFHKMEDDLDYICRTIIDDFYSDYMPNSHTGVDPVFYRRTFDLYNIYRIYVEDGFKQVALSSDFMQHEHHQGNDYIYKMTIEQGYHGGSYGKNTPQPNTPYYRKPYPEYTEWGRPAVKSAVPPEKIFELEVNEYFDKSDKEFHNKIFIPAKKIVDEMKNRAIQVYGKGGK